MVPPVISSVAMTVRRMLNFYYQSIAKVEVWCEEFAIPEFYLRRSTEVCINSPGTSPNPTFGRRPQFCVQSVIRRVLAFPGLLMQTSVVTLAMHYNASVLEAFNSVEHIMRD